MEPLIRPLQRHESGLLEDFVDRLSPHSRYLRFHSPIPKLPPVVRRALLDVDGRNRIALVAEAGDGTAIGLVHVIRASGADEVAPRGTEAEIAVAVADAWQRRGVGRRLVTEVTERARAAGIDRLTARVLPENTAALELFRAEFEVLLERRDRDAVIVTALLDGVGQISEDDILADLVA
ncbi:GNAT family N-acetyltransferase [Actinomycetospora endophytica]|uniref:GNAT family N-acetyltransferase n=1 Tax=Actinomycetospora endophytica TaxID=2291215 RepID=A0ABS8PAV5_9PSEU|nr:GNAT family N-acetyltransferase [Actinomycetospora endophytica]MCD2195374.1 GNAT family N-acetyltransferase [Actinomycetospora endophytica]